MKNFSKNNTNESNTHINLRTTTELDLFEFFQNKGPYAKIEVATASWYDSIPRVVLHNGGGQYERIWGSVNFDTIEDAEDYKNYLEIVQFRADQFMPEDSIWKK